MTQLFILALASQGKSHSQAWCQQGRDAYSSTGWVPKITWPRLAPWDSDAKILHQRETAKLQTLILCITPLHNETKVKPLPDPVSCEWQIQYLKEVFRPQEEDAVHYSTAVFTSSSGREASPGPDLYLMPLSSNVHIKFVMFTSVTFTTTFGPWMLYSSGSCV